MCDTHALPCLDMETFDLELYALNSEGVFFPLYFKNYIPVLTMKQFIVRLYFQYQWYTSTLQLHSIEFRGTKVNWRTIQYYTS